MGTTGRDVVVVGAGPTGLMLAAELALAGTDVAVVERRVEDRSPGTRARGFNARTIEVLDQRGVADRFLARARTHPAVPFGEAMLDLTDLPTRHPYVVGIPQGRVERLLGAWVAELGVPVLRGLAVTGLAQDEAGVDVRLDGGTVLRAGYVVGCDGGRSVVRPAAGIAFPGWDASRSTLIAELRMREEPPEGVRHDAAGVHGITRSEDGTTFSVVVTERRVATGPDPTLDDVRAALVAVFGSDFGAHGPTWVSRFTDATRQAESLRAGRILLAGDAAHVHSPTGGQGLGLGLQDAVNLGWKLARVAGGIAPQTLLDTYHAERHPTVARVLRHTMARTALQRRDDRGHALAQTVSELAALDEPRAWLTGLSSGLDVRYDLGGGHPLVGRRMPDLDLETDDGAVRVFELLHDARPVLLRLGGSSGHDASGWGGRVRTVDARHDGAWILPVVGSVVPPEAVLVRPDGHVAWVGGPASAGPADALTTWFGPPDDPADAAPGQGDAAARRVVAGSGRAPSCAASPNGRAG